MFCLRLSKDMFTRKRFLRSFFSALTCFLLVGRQLVLPLPATASPALGVAAAVEDLLYFAPAAEIATGGTFGVVLGALAVGTALYLWGQSQTDQLSKKAAGSYCVANPSNSGCVVYDFKIDGTGGGVHYPSARQGSVLEFVPRGDNVNDNVVTDGVPNSNYDAGSGVIVSKTPVPNKTGTYLPALSPSDQKAALQSLSDGDVASVLSTSPNSTLANNQVIPKGTVINDPSGQKKAFVTTEPYVVGSGQPVPGDPSTCTSNCSAFNQGTGTSVAPGTQSSSPPATSSSPAPTGGSTSTSSSGGSVSVTPATFSKPNFLSYGIQVFSKKFPFDIFGAIPAGTPGDCPSFSFFGQTAEICIIRDFLKGLKWPTLIGFLIWGVMSI